MAENWLGPGPGTARSWSVLLGALCMPVTFFWGRRMFDSHTALLAALILPTCFLRFSLARWATTDMTMSFFVLASYYYFFKGAQETHREFIFYRISYLCMGFGFLVKGPAAIVPLMAILIFLILSRQWNELRELQLGHGLGMIAAVNLSWFWTMV